MDNAFRDRRSPLGERLDLAGLDDLDDLLLDRLADSGQLLRTALEGELRDRACGLADAIGRAAVRDDAEGVLAADLEQVGEQVELGGHIRVSRQRLGHGAIIGTRMKTTICLPTYNEAENLDRIIRALEPVGASVLVIDDNSPDGTGAIADRLAVELDWVDVLHRERKQGLGPAYLAGFRRALAGGAELIVEMDCDFSHDPTAVPRLIAAAEDGADLVLGSRYVEGGSVSDDWGIVRRAISAGGSLYARLLLGIPVRDLTGGFKCFRRAVLEAIDLDEVHAKGYAFQIELTYRARRKGFRVVEVPIRFVDRTHGGSKMSRTIVLEAIWKVPELRLRALAGKL